MLKAVAARIAIFIGVLGAIFYIALTTTTDPLAALSPVDTAPLDLAPPAPESSDASVQDHLTPHRVRAYLPGAT